MFGQALWNWVRSARKRPYLDYSFEHLLEEASKLKPNDQNKAASIRSELGYRKLLKLEKKKLILDLLSKTNTNDVSKLEYEDEEEVTEPGAPHAQEETEAEESVEEEEPIELVDRDQEVSQALSVKTINTLYRNGIKDINQLEMMNDEDILSLKGIGQQALGQIRSVFPYSPNQTLSQPLRTESFATVPELTEENFIKSSALEVDPSFDLTDILPFASYPEIADYFSNHLNQNQIHALLSEVAKPRLEYFLRRCSGETLQNIADSQGITREGVRQHSAKIEKKTGIKPQDVVNYFNQAYSDANDRDILLAFEKDLSQTSAIGENVNDVWRNIHKREPTLADRINLFEKYCVPISLSELNIHIDLIEKSVGSYGGETYWKESTLRFLIWCMSIRLGKTGIMPKQVEMPSLLSRYIQKDFGGQRRAAEIFGLEYTGPVGSRNRSYWTEDRITDAVLNTQKYFCIPALSYWNIPTVLPF